MIDLTTIAQAVVALIAAILSAVGSPWIKSKTTANQREQIEAWVSIGVAAAEQIWKGQSGAGADKKRYVLELLAEKGFTINTTELNAMIEAAVLELGDALK